MKPKTSKKCSQWTVRILESAAASARTQINQLYPEMPGQKPSEARRDMLLWYDRWIVDVQRDPEGHLKWPPFQPTSTSIARIEANAIYPVSGIADVDWESCTISIFDIYIRPPRRH